MISIILPTRKRPTNILRLLDSVCMTMSGEHKIEICGRVDNDDIDSVTNLFAFGDRLDIRVCVGTKEINHGFYWNDAWKIARGDYFMMCGDDFVFRTKDWDKIMIEAQQKQNDIAYVYGEDGIQHGNIGTHGMVSKKWTDELGYFVPWEFNVFYHDTWLTDIARRIGRCIYIPQLYFEHIHPAIGKCEMDEVYTKMSLNMGDDTTTWNNTAEKRQKEAEKLQKLI